MKRKLRIVFMGSPDFAVASLDQMLAHGYEVAAIVTVPDKPSGRGKKIMPSPVKKYALGKGLKVLQPVNLKDEDFITALKALDVNLFVIVAFRMLPKSVWAMPELGSFNLHASLLPDYRGAAPINWAIIHGEQVTGLTTFFLNDKIDTGDIIYQEAVSIRPDETYGELHDRLKESGARLVIKTLGAIEDGKVKTLTQDQIEIDLTRLHNAPKINREDARIDWRKDARSVHNLVRGLCPNPAAFTELVSPRDEYYLVKVFRTSIVLQEHQAEPGSLATDGSKFLHVAAGNGFIAIDELQMAGKKRMNISEFLRGFKLNDAWKVLVQNC